jgi:hypothetical protein
MRVGFHSAIDHWIEMLERHLTNGNGKGSAKCAYSQGILHLIGEEDPCRMRWYFANRFHYFHENLLPSGTSME